MSDLLTEISIPGSSSILSGPEPGTQKPNQEPKATIPDKEQPANLPLSEKYAEKQYLLPKNMLNEPVLAAGVVVRNEKGRLEIMPVKKAPETSKSSEKELLIRNPGANVLIEVPVLIPGSSEPEIKYFVLGWSVKAMFLPKNPTFNPHIKPLILEEVSKERAEILVTERYHKIATPGELARNTRIDLTEPSATNEKPEPENISSETTTSVGKEIPTRTTYTNFDTNTGKHAQHSPRIGDIVNTPNGTYQKVLKSTADGKIGVWVSVNDSHLIELTDADMGYYQSRHPQKQ